MEWFITESERKKRQTTCCFEFQKGRFQNRFWREDSVCLEADIFDRYNLYKLFRAALPHFDYYGMTEVFPEGWRVLVQLSDQYGDVAKAVISELAPWAEECLQSEGFFTVCGI